MTIATDCPPAADLAALVAGHLSGDDLFRIAAHLDSCPDCQAAAHSLPAGGLSVVTLCREAAEAASSAAVGRYVAVRRHASGGLGEVHLAEDTELGRQVALKQIRPARADDPESRRRFGEAEITARLEHPGVVPVYGLVQTPDGRPHYAMRFVAGESLHDAVRAYHANDPARDPGERRLALRGLLTRFVTVCQTIAFAHSRGIVHRDLKPANVMLGPYGETLVVDWGLAKQMRAGDEPAVDAGPANELRQAQAGETAAGSRIGTPSFMSPEQAAGRNTEVGPASDVFGLGAMLYAILTGRPPVGDQTVVPPRQVNRAVSSALDAVCRKALAPSPKDRYESAAAVGAEVERWLAGEPVLAYPERLPARTARWARRNRVAVAGLAVGLLVAAVLGGAGGAWLARAAADRRAEQGRLQTKDTEAIDRALAEVPALIRVNRVREAIGLLDQTEAGLSEFAPVEARGRLEQARADVRLAERLDVVRLAKAVPQSGKVDTAAVAVPGYRAEFERHGLDLFDGGAADVGRRVAASVVRDALLMAIDDWACEDLDDAQRTRLTLVARAADPHPWRDAFRDALARRDRPATVRLAETVDVDEASPAVLFALATPLGDKTPEAERLLRRAQARYPADFWVNFRLGTCIRRRGDQARGAEAAGYYRVCLAERPGASVIHLSLGNALLDIGDRAGAAAAFRRATELDPGFGWGHTNLGVALGGLGDQAGAAAALRKALDLDPTDDIALHELGIVLYRHGDRAEAETVLRRAIAIKPRNPETHAYLGHALFNRGDLAGADAAYRQALALDPRNAEAHTGVGLVLLKRGDRVRAEAALRRAVECDPKDGVSLTHLGRVLFQGGNLMEAEATLRKAVDVTPNVAHTHYTLGHVLFAKGDLPGAEAALRRAVELRPRFTEAQALLGNVLYKRGDLAAAEATYRRTIEIDPKSGEAHNNLAHVLIDVGRFEEARATAQKAVELVPPGPGRQKAVDHVKKCEWLIKLDRKLPDVLRGEITPADPGEHVGLADLAVLRKRYAGAARMYEELFQKHPPPPGAGNPRRFTAAAAAVNAGCGRGVDDPAPEPAEQARWRQQGLAWMRDELKDVATQAMPRDASRATLRRWQTAAEFAVVREANAELPADEQADWRKFWTDVAAALRGSMTDPGGPPLVVPLSRSYRKRVKSFLPNLAELPPPPRLPGWDEPFRIGNVELESRFTLAPLAGYTNLPFRMSVRDVGGVGLCTTDLVNARAILKKSERTMELLATCPEDRPLGIQIYGGGPDEMAEGARWVEAYGATIIDINMGCPVRKVVKGGGGSAMMCDTTGATVELVRRVVEAVKVPVTVKMRLGWDADALTAPYFAREFEQIGVAAITIHGRTREQGFSGSVSLAGIRAVVEAVSKIPVIGNGDVRSVRDADRMMRRETGCAAIAIGRGALANPWFFRQLNHWLATGRPGPRGTYDQRLDFMLLHFRRMMDWKGERGGCLQFRKMAAWYCKALRTGKVIQQVLVNLDKPQTLQDIADRLRDQGPPAGWQELDAADANVHVPAGPIAHW